MLLLTLIICITFTYIKNFMMQRKIIIIKENSYTLY